MGFVVCGLAVTITEARTATWGLDTKAFFAGENAGLQQPGGPSLPFKSPTKLGYECFSYFFSCSHCKCTVVCLIHPLNDLAERYLSNKPLFTTTAGYRQHGVSAESRSAARRPSVHFAPLDTYGDSLGCFVASRKSVGEGSLTQYRVGLRNAPKVGH